MHRAASFGMSAALAALIVASASAPASACYSCDYGYAPVYAYAAPPVYAYAAPPVYAYYGPPTYSYYAPSAYEYYTRVNVFRGPRWDYSAAYYTSPVVYGGYLRRPRAYGYYAAPQGYARPRAYGYNRTPRVYARPFRAYVRGPIVRTWRRW